MTAPDKAALRALANNAITSHSEAAFVAAYIAAANPKAVLALLDEVERLREALEFVYPRLDALPDSLRIGAERIVSAALEPRA